MTNALTTLQRIHGALFAHAAGDCLGATTEFLTAQQIHERYGRVTEIVGGGAFDWRPGQGTDDTDLQLLTTESLITGNGTLDLADQATRLIDWYEQRPPDIGNTTSRGIRQLIATNNPTISGVTDPRAAGNGSLMRMLAPGLAITDMARRHDFADRSGAITHAAPDCRSACVAYTEVLFQLIDGATPDAAIAAAANVVDLTETVSTALKTPSLDHHCFSHGGHVAHSLAVAIAALRDAESTTLKHTIERIVNLGGDADTNAAIAGGLLGARHGIDAVPTHWTTALEQGERLQHAGNSLHRIRVS